ncbi:restriction endonuclease subunit S [Fibrobacter sp. UBA4309]|uniref:restriction endonuclease subunit S n=1 Tax=Fibrobacter sp. UBA4309 TaxID=1946537 RepID=UPI0025BDDFE9|nr:restriction endonuclease subunit S [Fibrobacter sp. UBA4309]
MRKMKDSGVEWIGQIPSDWDVSKIKYLIKSPLQYGANESGIDYDERLPRYIRITDITMDNELKEDGKLSLDNTTAKPYLLKDEDILFARSGASVGKTFFYRKIFGASAFAGYLIRASLNKKVAYPKFVFYNTLGLNYENWKNQSFSQATIQNIGADKYNEYILPIPPITEQQKIADFLDEKCGEIDSIRSDVQREIEILNDYKKSVITEAVTKGLNPKAKLKDSGIEWIGKIPEGWDSIKAKYLFKQRNSKGNTIDLQLLSPSQKFGVIPQSKLEELTTQKVVKLNEKVNLAELKTIHQGDFCISLRSFQGGFEYSEYEGVVSPAYQVFYSIVSCCNGYYRYLFKEKSFIEKMNSFTMSLRDGKNIAFEDFANSEMPVPPLSEQKAIADYLDEKCSEINATIADKQRQLETLDEYKKSLIFEYVTGKKEVS